jgi:hypothetical protein
MHVFIKIPRPEDRPLETTRPLLPRLYVAIGVVPQIAHDHHRYKTPAGPSNGYVNSNDPKRSFSSCLRFTFMLTQPLYADYLRSVLHNAALCDRCMTPIQGEWFRCAYCAKDLCDACEAMDTHDDTHVFMVFKAPVDMHQLR